MQFYKPNVHRSMYDWLAYCDWGIQDGKCYSHHFWLPQTKIPNCVTGRKRLATNGYVYGTY